MPNLTIAASKIRAKEIIAARLEMSRKIAIAKAEAAEHEKQLIEKIQRKISADIEKYGTSEFSTYVKLYDATLSWQDFLLLVCDEKLANIAEMTNAQLGVKAIDYEIEYLKAKSAYEKKKKEEGGEVKDETKTHLGYGGCASNANIPMDEALEVEENDEVLKASASPDGIPVVVPKKPTAGRRFTI